MKAADLNKMLTAAIEQEDPVGIMKAIAWGKFLDLVRTSKAIPLIATWLQSETRREPKLGNLIIFFETYLEVVLLSCYPSGTLLLCISRFKAELQLCPLAPYHPPEHHNPLLDF